MKHHEVQLLKYNARDPQPVTLDRSPGNCAVLYSSGEGIVLPFKDNPWTLQNEENRNANSFRSWLPYSHDFFDYHRTEVLPLCINAGFDWEKFREEAVDFAAEVQRQLYNG
jgi:hypothetical protein